MSVSHLISFAADENHVKFRSTLSEMLYGKLSEAVKEKTKDMVAEIFKTERVDETPTLVEYVSAVIEKTEQTLGIEMTEDEITEAAGHIVSILESHKEANEGDDDSDVEVHIDSHSHDFDDDEEEEPDAEEEEENEEEEDEEEEDEDEEDEDEEEEEDEDDDK